MNIVSKHFVLVWWWPQIQGLPHKMQGWCILLQLWPRWALGNPVPDCWQKGIWTNSAWKQFYHNAECRTRGDLLLLIFEVLFHLFLCWCQKVQGDDCPISITTFEEANLWHLMLTNIKDLGYNSPTPIQKVAIPAILAKRDLMASAVTGSGKTVHAIFYFLYY